MTHNIALNFNTDLAFESRVETYPTVVTRTAYSVEKARFTAIERTRFLGYVDVSTAEDDGVPCTVDGQTPPDNTVTFSAEERTSPDGTRNIIWNVYSLADTSEEDDLDIENVATADIPPAIVGMLTEL